MNRHEKDEISSKRNYWVVKRNELIQKNRFELSLTEQKTVAFICSMLKRINKNEDIQEITFQLRYEFNIRDYCKVCGIDYAGGKNYKSIKDTLKHLSDRSMWIEDEKSEKLMRWLSYVEVNKNSEKVLIEVDRTIAPFLFELKEKFTKYQLFNILAMRSAFSVRMYELLKSYAYLKDKVFELNELKRLLGVETVKSYERFPDFRRKVLEVAEREINELTDINIKYEAIKKGKKVIKINFLIELKSPLERAIAGATANDRLDNTASN